jgi:hypothetical protein
MLRSVMIGPLKLAMIGWGLSPMAGCGPSPDGPSPAKVATPGPSAGGGTGREGSAPAGPVARETTPPSPEKSGRLTPESLAIALASEETFKQVPDEAWRSIDGELAAKVVRAWHASKDEEIRTMLRNAAEDAALSGVARGLEPLEESDGTIRKPTPETVEAITGYLEGVHEIHLGALREVVLVTTMLEAAVGKMGPAAAPALLGVGEEQQARKLGPEAVPFLARSAGDPRSPERFPCWFFLEREYPLSATREPGTDELLAIARTEGDRGRIDAITALASRTGEAGRVAAALMKISGPPLVEAEVCRTLAYLRAPEVEGPRWIIDRARALLGQSEFGLHNKVHEALTATALADRGALDAIRDLLTMPAEEFPHPLRIDRFEALRRTAALRADLAAKVGEMGRAAEPLVPALESLLRDPGTENPESIQALRISVSVALGRVGAAAGDVLLRARADGIPEATFGLAELAPADGPDLPQVLAWLKANTRDGYSESSLRDDRLYCHMLADRGPTAAEAAPLILERMRRYGPHFMDQNTYARTLARLGPEARRDAVALLQQMYQNAGPPEPNRVDHRPELLELLGLMGVEARPALPLLLEETRGQSANTIQSSIRALGKIALADKDAVDEVIPAIASHLTGDYSTVQAACLALGSLGPGGRAAVPELKRSYESSDSEDEQLCHLRTLGNLGEAAWAASALDRALKEGRFSADYRRTAARERLAELRLQSGGAATEGGGLARALASTPRIHVSGALRELSDADPAAIEAALPVLRRALTNRIDPWDAAEAARALARLAPDDPTLRPRLDELSRSPDPTVRKAAREAGNALAAGHR